MTALTDAQNATLRDAITNIYDTTDAAPPRTSPDAPRPAQVEGDAAPRETEGSPRPATTRPAQGGIWRRNPIGTRSTAATDKDATTDKDAATNACFPYDYATIADADHDDAMCNATIGPEPTYRTALAGPAVTKWRAAMDEKDHSLPRTTPSHSNSRL